MRTLFFLLLIPVFFLLGFSYVDAQQPNCPLQIPVISNPEKGQSYSIQIRACRSGNHLLHIRDADNNLERSIELVCTSYMCPVTLSFPNEGQKKVYVLFAGSVQAEREFDVQPSSSTFVPTCNYQESRTNPIPTCDNDTNPTNGPCCPSRCTSASAGAGVQRCGASTTCIANGQTCSLSSGNPCCIPSLCKLSDPLQGPVTSSCQPPDTPTPIPPPQTVNLTPPCKGGQCNTALGEFRVDNVGQLISQIFVFGLAIGGAAAALLVIYAGFILMTSGGNKERIQGARETLVSAIAGLVFILLSFGILSFIAKNVLNIPGF